MDQDITQSEQIMFDEPLHGSSVGRLPNGKKKMPSPNKGQYFTGDLQ